MPSPLSHEFAPCFPGFEAINRFWDPQRQLVVAKILPGEYYVTNHDEMIGTVLGSCVSACIRDTLLGLGGINHFMLPSNDSHDQLAAGDKAARYGSFAMEQLINTILKFGGHRKHLEAKLTGGSRIITGMGDIGASNIIFAQQYLDQEGIVCIAEDLGGVFPRKLLYYPKTGQLHVKKLGKLNNDTLILREQDYQHSLQNQSQGGVEFF